MEEIKIDRSLLFDKNGYRNSKFELNGNTYEVKGILTKSDGPKVFIKSINGKEVTIPGGYDSEKIPGLKCPDCGAQALKTDQPGVASCGDYLGWYFLYTYDMDGDKPKLQVIIENGEYTQVPVYLRTKFIV